MDNKIILQINHLSKIFNIKSSQLFVRPAKLKAVNNISFSVQKGETFGIIGESGCGKSTLGKLIIRLIDATGGEIIFDGQDIRQFNKQSLRMMRRQIQMVFQDPYASLDPRKTILDLIKEPMIIHNIGEPSKRNHRVENLLQEVGLATIHANRYPHELSGGQRQRVNVARALALNPQIIVCDEPVSALDVSVQARVLNMMKEIQKKYNLTYLFISHDLSIVKYMSKRIAIMYLGKIMEIGSAKNIYKQPLHPYTVALFSAIPPDSPFEEESENVLEGDVPSPLNLPKGCEFSTRCHRCMAICLKQKPNLKVISEDHSVACHLY